MSLQTTSLLFTLSLLVVVINTEPALKPIYSASGILNITTKARYFDEHYWMDYGFHLVYIDKDNQTFKSVNDQPQQIHYRFSNFKSNIFFDVTNVKSTKYYSCTREKNNINPFLNHVGNFENVTEIEGRKVNVFLDKDLFYKKVYQDIVSGETVAIDSIDARVRVLYRDHYLYVEKKKLEPSNFVIPKEYYCPKDV
jgi:hypothetical protein